MKILCRPTDPTREGISRDKCRECHECRIPKRPTRHNTRSNSDDNTAKARDKHAGRHLPHNANTRKAGKNTRNNDTCRGTGGNSSKQRTYRRNRMTRRAGRRRTPVEQLPREQHRRNWGNPWPRARNGGRRGK